MKTIKKIGIAFLSVMFFAILSITIMLVTDVAFNKTTTFFERYNNFEFASEYKELNE